MSAGTAQGGFRPGEDLFPGDYVHDEPTGLSFTPLAEAGGTDFDVLMGYQLILGRDPESSFVIADAKTSPVGAFLRALMGSGEFQSAVLDKLAGGRPLPHESASLAPAPEQLDWLFRLVRLPKAAEEALREAPDWREWLRTLTAAPGFPHPPSRGGPDPANAGIAAQSADDGFVLVHLEQPKPGDRLGLGSVVNGSGWAIAPADVTEVSVHLDDRLLTHARYGLPRPDVARSFPHYRHVDHCGFTFTATIPQDARVTAASRLLVSVRTGRGELGRKAIRLTPPAETVQAPSNAGAPETWPIRLAVDEAVVDLDRMLRLRGWAASHLKLRALTATLGDTRLGEVRHGLPRPDIARVHPGYPNAAQAGFALVHPLPADAPAGPGFVRVQAEDEQGRTRQAILPVTLPALPIAEPDEEEAQDEEAGDEAARDDTIRFACDAATLSEDGALSLAGWAIDPGGAAPVEMELDGVLLGTALTGRPRPDIGRRFPGEAGAWQSGFAFSTTLDPAPEAGRHRLALRLLGRESEHLIEQDVFVGAPEEVAHPPAERGRAAEGAGVGDMRLEVDHPALDGDAARNAVRGALTISGWAIGRFGMAEVAVFCDERLLGRAHLGMRREDIGAAFGDYEGALLSGYAQVLPPGTLPEGRHRIRIVATAVPGPYDTSPAIAQRSFSLQVEHYDALPPEGDVRVRIPPAEAAFGLRLLARQGCAPVFDVLIAATTPNAAGLLAETLASLAGQVFQDWRATVLLASRAASAERPLRAVLATHAGRVAATWPGRADAKLPRSRLAEPGPRFGLRLRAGDVLGADALLAFALQASAVPQADFIYADDLRLEPTEGRRQPFLKPGWSPDLLLATNYVGRAWCASHALIQRAGLSADAPDYEAVLRLTEHAASVEHVPRVLCRRGEAADTAEQEQAALAACLSRRGIVAQVEAGSAQGTWRVRRHVAPPVRPRGAKARAAGRISIIIPTCAARGLVRTAIKTLRETAAPAIPDGRRIEIVALDNIPPQDEAAKLWLRKAADVVVDMPGPFNWSRFNNAGAAAATGEYLLFLNDDIEATQPGWLEALLEHAQRPEVGVVGARLLYPDGKVQHAGQYLSDSHARHAFRFDDGAAPGPFGLAGVAREVISVTGACQMIRADTFRRLGGFDEAHSIINNDLDFCFRSRGAGLSVVFTPHATLVHHELASRAALDDNYDEQRFAGAWRQRFLRGDPFRNPRMGLDSDHYAADPEPVVELHVGRRGPAIADITRILAIKLDHIGDFLTALPALHHLAARFPNARIDLLAPAATAELARQQPVIAETIVFDFFHARSGEGQKGVGDSEFRALRDRLAPSRYDMAIDLRMQPETRGVLPYTGAAFLVGYDHDHRFAFLDVALEWEGDRRLAAKRAHISERLVDLVSAAEDACRDAPPAPELAPLLAADVPVLAALPAAFRARRLVCVHPGVGNPVRQWPPAHYAALIDLLVEEGLHAVLIGGPDEAEIADEVLRRVGVKGAVESLVGRVKLAQLPDVMRACALFVGNNSGPQHLAASLGLPAIGIHSGVVDAMEWAPLGSQAMALRRQMICGPCYLEFASDCPRDLACLTGLRPSEVFAACRKLLASGPAVMAPEPPARRRPARKGRASPPA